MNTWIYLHAVVVVLTLAPVLQAGDANWPQWRGPDRDDVSQETGLLQDWPKSGPPHVWMVRECGLGYSGPAIVGDQLFLLGARQGEEQLICLQVSDGKEIWATRVGSILENAWGDGPRSTPTVDGDRVYALSFTHWGDKGTSSAVKQTMEHSSGPRRCLSLGGDCPTGDLPNRR